MKVNIPSELLVKKALENTLILKISVINVKEKSTVVLINGKKFELPVLLDKNKNYQGFIKENEFIIVEKNDHIKAKQLKAVAGKMEKTKNTRLEHNLQSQGFNFQISDILKKLIVDPREKRESKDYYFTDKKSEEYFFIFNLALLNQQSRIFLKIDKSKNVLLNILPENEIKQDSRNIFLSNLKKRLSKKINRLTINFLDKSGIFYDKINSLLIKKNVDIKA